MRKYVLNVFVFMALFPVIFGFLILSSKVADAQDFKIRGRLHMDAFYGIQDADNFSNGFNNRRARLGVHGNITDKWEGRIEIDFADAVLSPEDLFLRRSFNHGGRLWIGQFKVPQGLNQLTCDNKITFIERSMINNVISDARKMGIAYEYHSGICGFKTMFFGRATGQREDIAGNMPFGIAFRGVFNPKIGAGQLHVGFSIVYQDHKLNNELRFSDRPEARDAKGGDVKLIDITVPDVNNSYKGGFELLYIKGPFSIESEYMNVYINKDKSENPLFFGHSVQSSYIITGESRSYKNGVVGTVVPQSENGAWEVAIRYSVMNLDDEKAQLFGGSQSNITIGLNRYISSKLRFMANVVYVNLENSNEKPILGVLRAQYSF